MQIKDISLEFEGENFTKYGFFALLVWFLMDVLQLAKRFKIITVKDKRNRENPVKRRKKPFLASLMCLSLVTIILLSIKRFEKVRPLLSAENALANLLGLPRFFGVTTARNFINQFSLWHLRQLDNINTKLLADFGESSNQDLPIADLDGTTHSLESKKREKAVIGYNKKNKGKPCYQWAVAFVRQEIIVQNLYPGNTKSGCYSILTEMVENCQKKLGIKSLILRVDGGYLSADTLEYAVKHSHQIITTVSYNWVQELKKFFPPLINWKEYDKDTKICDLGWGKPLSKTLTPFRIILVEKKQDTPKIKKRKKILRYALVSNISFLKEAEALYEFYHQRQTIENFFKEAKNPFHAGKMPSQLFRGNQVYLSLVTIAYNSFQIFKKNICQQDSKELLLKRLQIV